MTQRPEGHKPPGQLFLYGHTSQYPSGVVNENGQKERDRGTHVLRPLISLNCSVF